MIGGIKMKLSTRTIYGLRMLVSLATQYNKGPVQISEISKEQEVSVRYLGQISIILKNNGLIDSTRGANGGYFLIKDPKTINLREIVEILEGDIYIVNCTDENSLCARKGKCVTKRIWDEINSTLRATLEKYNLQDLIDMDIEMQGSMFYI